MLQWVGKKRASVFGMFLRKEKGLAGMEILYALLGVMVILIVLGSAIPVLWPLIVSSGDNISSMTGTDSGTSLIQAFWPIILLLVGLGVAVALIIFAIKKFRN